MRKGFTLLETIIYAALLTAVIGAALASAYQILSAGDQLRSRTEVEEEARFVMRKIAWAVAGTTAITAPAANATSSLLSVTTTYPSANPIAIDASGGAARIRAGSGAATVLNGDTVRVTDIVFTHRPATSNASAAVSVSLTVQAASSDIARATASTTLSTIFYLHP